MNSINAGRQQASFNWYKGTSDIKEIIITPATAEASATLPVTFISDYSSLPSNLPSSCLEQTRSISLTPSVPLPVRPSSSESLLNPSVQEFHPVEDQLKLKLSPKEPSRIRRPPMAFHSSAPHLASKHSHPVEDVQQSGELPLKRVRVGAVPESDLWDYNTLVGTDRVNFEFGYHAPAYITALEEAERADRIKRRANPVLVGKLFNIQKEFMRRVNKPIAMPFPPSMPRELTTSIADLKAAVIEKGLNMIDSSKNVINSYTPSLKSTLDAIANEAEEVTPSRPLESAGALVGKAAIVLDDAVHYTTSMIASLALKAPESSHDAEWSKLMQEKERARRINESESLLSPSFDTRKIKMENQLLRTVALRKTQL